MAVAALLIVFMPSALIAETMTVATLYTTAINPANGVHPLWTPVQHYLGKTFVVLPDVDLRPMVTEIDRDGTTVTVPLDPNPDYLATPDGHNRFTMGIDKDGYLHIAGDMHGYAEWAANYVERYQYQNMLYWRSNKRLDVTGGFTFAGGSDSATRMPGEEWGGDSRFFNDRNGDLCFSSRVRAFTGGSLSGSEPFIAYGVYRYDTASGRWTALGGTAPGAAPGATHFNTVLYWEHTDAFEAYQAAPRFDVRNRLHFAIAGKSAGSAGQGLIYARSDDFGMSWKRADDTSIPGLPIRGKDGEPNQGDLVIRSPRVAQQSPLCIDRHGNVAVHGDGTWRTWNGKRWAPVSGGTGILAPDGMLTNDGGSTIDRTTEIGQPPARHASGFGQVFSFSELGLRTTGAIYGVGLPMDTNFVNAGEMSVFRAVFKPTNDGESAANMPPASPTIFFARAESARVWLSWTATAGATRYVVKRAELNRPQFATLTGDVADNADFTDTTCRNGTTYRYTVTAANHLGNSPDSRPVTVTPRPQPSRAPIIQTAVGHNRAIVLRWLPLGSGPASSYTIRRMAGTEGAYQTIATGVTGLSFRDKALDNDQTYHYVIRAVAPTGAESADSAPITASPFRWEPILHYQSVGKNDHGKASASAENGPREVAAAAFDGSRGSKWLMSADHGWLQYQFAGTERWTVTRYRLTSGQDGPGRDPRDWRFQASDDGTTWVTLDRQTDQVFSGRNAINTYTVNNHTAYRIYRLEIDRNNGNGLTQLAELDFWHDGAN